MEEVTVTVTGVPLAFESARAIARLLAARDEPETMLVAWCDREQGKHSPSCVKCEIHGAPGWEVYGRNHGGRLRIALNNGAFVFIHT